MRDVFNRKLTMVFILGIIFYFGVFNFFGITNEAYAVTNVWPEKSKVEFGESIKIHYNFDDREHCVSMQELLKTNWFFSICVNVRVR